MSRTHLTSNTPKSPFKLYFWGKAPISVGKTLSLPIAKTDEQVIKIMDLLKKNGFSIYEKGGSVRNRVAHQVLDYFNVPINDYDIITNAHPDEIITSLKNQTNAAKITSRKHPIVQISLKNGTKIDISTFRADLGKINAEGQIVENISFGNLVSDHALCDYTINSLYADPAATENNIIYFDSAYSDLKSRILRIPGNAVTRVIADPIIILRGIRFATTLDFQFAIQTAQAIQQNVQLIKKANPQHISYEIEKILFTGRGEKGWHMLKQFGLIPHLFPTLTEFVDTALEQSLFKFLHYLDNQPQADLKNKAASFFAIILWPSIQQKILLQSANEYENTFNQTLDEQNKLCTLAGKIKKAIKQYWRAWVKENPQEMMIATRLGIDQANNYAPIDGSTSQIGFFASMPPLPERSIKMTTDHLPLAITKQ